MGTVNEFQKISLIINDVVQISVKTLSELTKTLQYVQPIEPMNVVFIKEYANGVQISNNVIKE